MIQRKSQESNKPEWLDRKEYPFKSHYFDSPIGRMHYVDEGQGDPIVMVHGNPGWSFEFRNIIKALSSIFLILLIFTHLLFNIITITKNLSPTYTIDIIEDNRRGGQADAISLTPSPR